MRWRIEVEKDGARAGPSAMVVEMDRVGFKT